MTALPDREGIARLVPHAGSMCLLDRVLGWDASGIRCVATSHRDPANPMRTGSGLLAVTAIEYAAQATALHGGLGAGAGGATARMAGMLASARNVRCHRVRLDDLAGDLVVEATQLAADERQLLYAFTVGHGGEDVVTGRLSVVLAAGVVA